MCECIVHESLEAWTQTMRWKDGATPKAALYNKCCMFYYVRI